MMRYIFIILLTLFVSTSAWSIEFEETMDSACSPNPCGCGVSYTAYSFNQCKFGDTGNPWGHSHQSSGGINNSGYHRTTAVGDEQDDCWWGVNVGTDSQYYWRGCWRMSSNWDASGLYDQKLSYTYTSSSGNINIFFHSGVYEPPGSYFSGEGLELTLYTVTDGWVPANHPDNIVQHTNYFLVAEHFNEWWCLEVQQDYDQNPWVLKMWITTAWGAANLSDGQTGTDGGVQHFNNYLYVHRQISHSGDSGDAAYALKIGAFINETVPDGATMDQDEIVVSESKIGHPFGDGADPQVTISYDGAGKAVDYLDSGPILQ